jgi:lia operon protein LiaG
MSKRILFCLVIAFSLVPCLAVFTTAQDFQKTYSLGPEGSISIHNVSGDIQVKGYDGETIQVKGFKEGKDRDRVEVDDRSDGNHVELRVNYPHNCNASIRFQMEVPRAVRYRFDALSTASGDIEVGGVTGDVKVDSASGDVLIKDVSGTIHASTASGDVSINNVKGPVSASSASGDVEVQISRLEGTNRMAFSTASGDVSVKLPGNLDAEIEISSISGSIHTDFPIEIQEPEHGPGSHARGRLGSGATHLSLSSASGDVSLLRF